MILTDLRLLLKHCPEMASVEVNHPDCSTRDLRQDLWLLTRYAHTQEIFGDKSVAQIAVELAEIANMERLREAP